MAPRGAMHCNLHEDGLITAPVLADMQMTISKVAVVASTQLEHHLLYVGGQDSTEQLCNTALADCFVSPSGSKDCVLQLQLV